MGNIYDFPEYYELVYSYRNIEEEVDCLEEAIAKYSKIPVNDVLELACGNSPHMLELIQRGYNYYGLDLSSKMIDFARGKLAENAQDKAQFILADLQNFQLEKPVDFLYIMIGSLYVQDTEGLLSHFKSAEAALKPGGLYFLDWCVDFNSLEQTQDRWVMKTKGISITTSYTTRLHDAAKQLYEEKILFKIRDRGHYRELLHSGYRRAIFPQEFLLASTHLHNFEFVGWWNDWNFNYPLKEGRDEIVRPITILRRL